MFHESAAATFPGHRYHRSGADYTYLVVILVKGRTVYCIEAAGETKQIAPQMDAIRAAIRKWPLS